MGLWDWLRRRGEEPTLNPERLPQHVAIIMDGNGRWAQKRGLPRSAGHRIGADSVRAVVTTSAQLGIKVLTLYAFSTENWKRSESEVGFLMDLLDEFLASEAQTIHENKISFRVVGDIEALPASNQQNLAALIESTKDHPGMKLVLALNYGGRQEILQACRSLAQQATAGEITPQQIDADLLRAHLYAPDLPDPDLVIRTSGEMRLSNFLLWQVAYAEFYNTPILWPDFRKSQYLQALKAYGERERRYGGTN